MDWNQVATLLTALTAIGALIFTGLSLGATRDQNAAALQGQITERFSTAVEQLGSEQVAVRVGGIYSLERLARDSPMDQPTITQVLSSFVRQNTINVGDQACEAVRSPVSELLTRSGIDVQNAMIVIGRRAQTTEDYAPLNFRELCFGPIEVEEANFSDADFFAAELRFSILPGALLQAANLSQADFGISEMDGSNLRNANLLLTNFEGVSLVDANLSGAFGFDASFRNADMMGADLTNTSLEVSEFAGANLSDVRMENSSVPDSDFRDANLSGAVLRGSDFSGADFSGANLSGADFTGANLTGAILTGAVVASTIGLPVP